MLRYPILVAVLAAGLVLAVGCRRTLSTPPSMSSGDHESADTPEPKIDVPEGDLKELVRGNNEFAIELFKKMAEIEKGNIVISPYSIRAALAMVYAGAQGETKKEMKKVLRFSLSDDKLSSAILYKTKKHDFTDDKQNPVSEANSLWIDEKLHINKYFEDKLKIYHSASLHRVSFADSNNAVQKLNEWLRWHTKGANGDYFHSDQFDNSVRMVLLNAIRFTAKWQHPFDEKSTKTHPFYGYENMFDVKMMDCNLDYQYYKSKHAAWLRLQFAPQAFEFIIAVPESNHTPLDMFVTDSDYRSALDHSTSCHGNLKLPKSTSSVKKSLNSILSAIGLRNMFSNGVGFEGIASGQGIVLSEMDHETSLTIDEKGCEASSATSILMRSISLPRDQDYCVDRPYVFMIRNQATGEILLIGRLENPNK